MSKSIIEWLPKIVAEGRKEANDILEALSSSNRLSLQTNELVIPAKDSNYQDLFRDLSANTTPQERHFLPCTTDQQR